MLRLLSSKDANIFENHLNPVMLVFHLDSSYWVLSDVYPWPKPWHMGPMCQGFGHFSAFLHHFVSIGQISHQQHKGKNRNLQTYLKESCMLISDKGLARKNITYKFNLRLFSVSCRYERANESWHIITSSFHFLSHTSSMTESQSAIEVRHNKSTKVTVKLTLQMLTLLLSKAQGRKDIWKPSKLYHIGIHWIALAEHSQMSTHLPGFQSFSRFLHHFVLAKLANNSKRVNPGQLPLAVTADLICYTCWFREIDRVNYADQCREWWTCVMWLMLIHCGGALSSLQYETSEPLNPALHKTR